MKKDRQQDRQKKAGSPSEEGSADPTVCQQCFQEYEPPSDPRKDDGYCCDDCEELHDQQLLGELRAPDGTLVDDDGFIIEPGHPQKGALWSSCWGADPSWRPTPASRRARVRP